MYTHILFDLDGTISDPGPGITKSVQYALRAEGIEVKDPKVLEKFIGPPLVDSFMEFYGFDEQRALRAVEKYRERFSKVGMYENTLYPGMRELLTGLKRDGFHLAVASSKPEYFVTKILGYFGILECFEATVGSELDGRRSRKEEVVEEALRRLFLEKEIAYDAAVMVGDRKFDILGAREMGLPAIGVAYGYAPEGELKACAPWAIASDVEELGRILRTPLGGVIL